MFVDPTDLARHAVCLGMTGSSGAGGYSFCPLTA